MFSSLPKLADKAFVIGFLVPVLVALAALLLGFREFQWVVKTGTALTTASDLGKLTVLAAAVILTALLLLLLNRPIYRAWEGYIGLLAAPPLRAWTRYRWGQMRSGLKTCRAEAEKLPPGAARNRKEADYIRGVRRFRRRYPRTRNNVLPTRFGNVNRAFETYAACVYNAEAILIWPRLAVILPKALQDGLADGRSQVNCFLNVAALMSGIAKVRILIWAWEWLSPLLWGGALPPPPPWPALVTPATGWVATVVIAWLAYEMAIERALALGDQVRVAFDLHLHRLPAKLGYVYPDNLQQRAKFWAVIEDAFDYQTPIKGLKLAPADAEADDPKPPKADKDAAESEGDDGDEQANEDD